MSGLTKYQNPGLVVPSESPKLSDVFTKHEGQLFEASTDSDQSDISENLGLFAFFALTALGGLMSRSSDQTSSSETDGSTATDGSSSARLIDSPVVGISVYQQNGLIGITDSTGGFAFSANNGLVTFKVGTLTVGSFDPSAVPSDNIITPFELAGASRDTDLLQSTTPEAQLALKIAKALQMLDQDGNPDNNIFIDDTAVADVLADGAFNISGSDSLSSIFTIDEIPDADATYHLEQSIDQFTEADYVTDEKAIIDGYIADAEVWLDLNGDGQLNIINDDGVFQSGEDYFTTRKSSSDGRVVLRETFELNGQTLNTSDYDVLVRSGVNIDTGIVNTMILSAPAEATVVTPLTTLVKRLMDDHDLSIEQAEAAVKTALVRHDASFSILHQDPIDLLTRDTGNTDALSAHKSAVKVVQATMGVAQDLKSAADSASVVASDADQVSDLAIDASLTVLVSSIVSHFQTNASDLASAGTVDPTSADMVEQILVGVENKLSDTLSNSTLDTAVIGARAATKSKAQQVGSDIDGAANVDDVSERQAQAMDTQAPGQINISSTLDGSVLGEASPVLRVGLRRTGAAAERHYENDTLILTFNGGNTVTHALTAQDIQRGHTRIDLSDLSVTLSDGAYVVSIASKDLAGNVGSPKTFNVTVDTTAPAAPSISSMSSFINDTTPTVSGVAEADASVDVYSGSSVVATTTADSSGNWSVTTSNLSTGANSLTAVAKDSAGNSSPASVAVITTVDTQAPDAPLISVSPGITNDTTPTVSGTAEALSTITLYRGANNVGTAIADSSGNWSVTTSSLPTGAISLTATATDRAGNLSSASSAISLTIDTTAPVINSVAVPAADSYKVGDTLNFTVATSENVNVSNTPQLALTIGGSARQASFVSGNGTSALVFSYTVQAGDTDSDGVSVGALSLNSGTIKDAAGNDLTLTLNTVGATSGILVDTTAPVAPSLAQNGNVVTVTAEANGSLKLTDNGVDVTGRFTIVQNPAGTYTATADLAQFAQSESLALTATVTDAAGNASAASSAVNVTIDPTVPTITSVTTPSAGSYNDDDSLVFTVNLSETVTVTGVPELTLSVGGVTQQASYVSGSGTNALAFSYAIQSGDNDSDGIAVSGLALNGGTITDGAGNALSIGLSQVGATDLVLVDTVAPSAPTITDPGATVSATPTLSGTAEANASVTLTSGGVAVGSGTADASGNWVITTNALSTGTPSVVAKATDSAGNISAASAARAITVDATAPTVASVTTPGASRSNAGDVLTFTVNTSEAIVVSGAGTPQLSLSIGSETRQASYASGSGTTSLVFSYTVQQGDNDSDGIAVTALSLNGGTLTDAVGNALNLGLTGVGDTSGVLADTMAPGVPAISLSGKVVTVTGESAGTLTIKDGATDVTAKFTVAETGGTYTATAQTGEFDGSESLSLTATVTDAAGNTSSSSAAVTGAIDTTAPAAPTLVAIVDTDNSSFDKGFTVTAGSDVAVTIDGAVLDDSALASKFTKTTAAGLDTYSAKASAFTGSEAVSVNATLTDIAGNQSAAATTLSLQNIDTTAPSAPSLVQNGNVVTVTAEANGSLKLTDNGVDVTGRFTIVQNPAGTYTATADLAQFAQSESLALTATVTDAAGNASAASSAVNVTIDPTVPTITSVTTPSAGSYNDDDSLVFTVNLSETVTVTGVPELTLSVGGVTQQASYVSGSGTNALAFSYAIQSGDNDSDGIAVSGLALNGGTITDGAGNALSIGLSQVGATDLVLVDTVAPSAPTITDPGATVSATPTLSGTAEANASVTLTSGGVAVGSGTADASGNWVITTNALSTGTPSVVAKATDSAGNISAASAARAITVDATAPTVASVTTPGASRSNAGDVLTFTVNTSEAIVVSGAGTPQLSLSIGSETRQASYASGSGTTSLVFSYTVQQGDNDSDGIAVTALSLNGGTLTDAVGNALNLGLTGVGDTSGVLADTMAPSVPAISLSGKVVTVTGESAGTLTIKDGATDVTAKFTVAVTAGTYTATAKDAQFDGSENLSLTATLTDLAGNESPASAAVSGAIDTTAPSTPTASSSGNVLTVIGESGGTLKLLDNTTDVTSKFTISEINGTYTATAIASRFSGSTTLSLTAKIEDASGNVSSASSSAAMTVDNTVYATTRVNTAAAEHSTNQPTLEGTGEVGSTVTLTASGSSVGSDVVGSDGTWSITTSALPDGYQQLDLSTDHGSGTPVPQTAVYSTTINTSSFAARTSQKLYDGVDEIILDTSVYRMGIDENSGVIGQKVYSFETTGDNVASAVSVVNSRSEQRKSLMAIAEATHDNQTIRVGTFAHDDLFAEAVGRDPQSDGLAKVTFNYLKQLTGGQHELDSSEPLRLMAFRAGTYFDTKQWNANDRERFSYIDAVDGNENEGRLHQDMGLHIDSVNSGSQSQIYEFMADIVGPDRDWGTQYDVVMVRPSIDQTHLDMVLDWAAETGGAVMFLYDSSSNRPDVVDPHPDTTAYLTSIGITPSGFDTTLAQGDYAPTRIDPFQESYLTDALGIIIDGQGTAADQRLVSVDDLTLPTEIFDDNGLRIADVTWNTSNSSAMSATGAIATSGNVTLTATITALNGATYSVDHHITAVKLLDDNGDSLDPGLRFEFLDWVKGQGTKNWNRADQLYETDLSKNDDARQPQEIFDLKAEGPLDHAKSSVLTLRLQGNEILFNALKIVQIQTDGTKIDVTDNFTITYSGDELRASPLAGVTDAYANDLGIVFEYAGNETSFQSFSAPIIKAALNTDGGTQAVVWNQLEAHKYKIYEILDDDSRRDVTEEFTEVKRTGSRLEFSVSNMDDAFLSRNLIISFDNNDQTSIEKPFITPQDQDDKWRVFDLSGTETPFVTLRTDVPESEPDLEKHVMLVSGYVVAQATGDYELEFGVDRAKLMQVFVETDSGYKSALNDSNSQDFASGRYLEQLTGLDMTAGMNYRIVAMVAKDNKVTSFSMQWKEPDAASFSDIPSENLIARPSVYPVAGRTDGNFFDFIDFENDPWAAQATADGNTDLNADTVWNQDEFDSIYPDINPVQSSEDISLDLEYYQAPIDNLILSDAVMANAKTVSLNVYDSTTGNLAYSLYNWSLDTSSTITMASFASQLETRLRADLSDNALTVTASGGVITLNDPDGGMVFEELIVGKSAELTPTTFDITKTKEEIWDQGASVRAAAGSNATFGSARDASGAFIGSLAQATRFSFNSADFELNNVKIYSKDTERFIDDETWVGKNTSEYTALENYDEDWKVHGVLEKTLNYYTGFRWDVQFDTNTDKIVYKVHRGGASDSWETVTPTLAEIHTGTLYDDLIENVVEGGRRESSISLGDITGQISVDITDLATSNPFTVLEQPLFGSVTIENDGSYRYNPTEVRFQGFDQFHVQVTDVVGRTHIVPVTIGTNDGVVEETSATAIIEFDDPSYEEPTASDYNESTAASSWTFQDLFFAQVAVQRPDSPYLNLVEGRWVKVKLNASLSSATAAEAPKFEVVVKDINGNEMGRRILTGPKDLPAATELDLPSKSNLATGVGHNDDDSYTAPIPGDWVAPGNKIEILANGVNIAGRSDFPSTYADSNGDIAPNIVGGGSPDISIGHFTLGAYNDTFLYVSTNDLAADILAAVPAQKVELLYRSGSTVTEAVRNRTIWDSPTVISSDQSIAAGAASYIEMVENPFGASIAGWARNLAIAVKKANFMSPLPGNVRYPDWMYASLSPDVGGGVGGGQTGSGNTATTATIHEFLGHGAGIGHPTENAYNFAYNWYARYKDDSDYDDLSQKTALQPNTLASYTHNNETFSGPFKVFLVNHNSPLWNNKLTESEAYAIIPDGGEFLAIRISDNGSGLYAVAGDDPIQLTGKEAEAVVALSQDLRFIITDNDSNNTQYMQQGSLGDNWYYDQNSDSYVNNYWVKNLDTIVENVRYAVWASKNENHPDLIAAKAANGGVAPEIWLELKDFVVEVPTPNAQGPILNLPDVIDIATRIPTIHGVDRNDDYYDNMAVFAGPVTPEFGLRTGPMAGSQGSGSPGRDDDSGLAFARFSDVEMENALVDRFSNMMQWRPNAVAGADTEDGGYAGDGYYQYFGLDQDVYTVADLTGVSGDTRKIKGIISNLPETNVVDFYGDEAVEEGHDHTDNVADDHTHTDDVTDDHDHDNSADHLGDSNIFLTGYNGKSLSVTGVNDTFNAWNVGQDDVRIASANTNQSVISFELVFDDATRHEVELVKGWQTITASNHQGTIEALMPHQVGVEIYSVILNIQDNHGHDHERGASFYADLPMFVYKTVGNLPAAYYDYLKPNGGIVFDAIADYALRVTYQTTDGLVTDHIQVPAKNSGGINLPVKGDLVRIDLLDATGGKQAYLENNVISSFVNPNALANLVLGGNDWFGVISDVELPEYHNGHALTWSASANDFIDLTTGAVTLDNLTANSSITASWTENGSQQQTTIGLVALSDELLTASLFPHGSIIVDDVDLPDSVFGYDVVWSSDDASVFTAAGVNAATAAGTATLTATLQNSAGTVRSIAKSFDVVPDTALAAGLQFDVFDLGSVYATPDIAGGIEFDADDDKLGFVALLQGGLDFENTNRLFEGTARNVVWHSQDARDFSAYTNATVGGGQKLFGDDEAEFRRFVNAAYRGRKDDTTEDVFGDVPENSLYVFSGLLRPDASDDYHFNLDMRLEGSFAIEVDGQMHHYQSINSLKTRPDPIALEAGESYKIWASVLLSREIISADGQSDRYDTVDLKWSTADQPGDSDWEYIPDSMFKHTPGIDMWANGNAPYASTGRVQFINETTDALFVDNTDFTFDIVGTDFGEFTQFVDNSDVLNASGTEDLSKLTDVILDGDLVLDFSEFDTSAVPDNGSVTLDLIVADAISGNFDSESTLGLDTDFSATIAVVDGTNGEDDILRLTIG